MSERCFVDTNLIIYANSKSEPDKQLVAARLVGELLGDGRCVISTQVLNEYAATALGKLKQPEEAVAHQLRRLEQAEVVTVTPEIIRRAVELRNRYRINYWDAAILAAAERAGCDILYTEDLNHGQVYGTVRVNNPFA